MKHSLAIFWLRLCLATTLIQAPLVYGQVYNSLVVSEILSDPTPVRNLPNAEYIELYNRTTRAISLKNWTIQVGERRSLLPEVSISAGAYLLLCAPADTSIFQTFGPTAGVSRFLLPNSGATLSLFNEKNTLVFSLTYAEQWWPAAMRGGYALEMVDSENPCGQLSNWKVSTHPDGGTPGRPNAVAATNADRSPPVAERVEVLSARNFAVTFNERLDSLQLGDFAFEGREISHILLESPSFSTIFLEIVSPLNPGQAYQLTLQNAADCAGNYARETTLTVGLPQLADSGDVVLNEILFDPRPGGVDFVEIYNQTSKFINLKNWSIGNLNQGIPSSFRVITTRNVLLLPYQFLALTIDPEKVAAEYPTEHSRNFLKLASMPAFPDKSGGVVLRDSQETIFDHFAYEASFHSPFLRDAEGVSLERLFPEKPASERSNWQSAASVVGYATPGYGNSQRISDQPVEDFFVEPEAFTPNGDGNDDIAIIRYSLPVSGQIGSIRIYDVQGRLIRYLINNQWIGSEGNVQWDGSDDQGRPVRTGYYLILIETFDAQGNQRQFKKRVAVVHP
ncbi:lamin tail domain-containing protein [Arundinibacter roseus]|uniref:lamin tail domain-containing protein n=1 Tax=Arundinibacter roseus TaxID=2070510 RepID=UPI001404BDDE|nr:lamin tail domain-containing protein [Arundinibacter roseus]